ncbi:hypothetical protein NC651_036304 [Populus alba x Populus x berolinensis]|nr:hypothetical protein NC651_036304 [Populus alba x Populus x berolinensis]
MSALFSCEKKQVVEIWDSLAKSSGSSVDKRLPNMFDSDTERLDVVLGLLDAYLYQQKRGVR